MNVYTRDYTKLTTEEYAKWQALRQKEIVQKIDDLEIRRSRFHDYPKAARHFISLFPNNYLDPIDLKDINQLSKLLSEFKRLINAKRATEQEILNFINHQGGFFVIASVLKEYFHFGHHDAYIFPEFQLGNSYKVDYLLVGKNSDGWNFVFVELEAPFGRITLKEGELGEVFRKGIRQVEDWDVWIQAYYSSLRETFNKYRKEGKRLPDEFFTLDRSRIHYVVIAGRRNNFNEKTYRLRRKMKTNSELILHYDNLIDTAERVIGQNTY